jgi:hypothetical protein
MNTHYNFSNYGNDLRLKPQDIENCSGSGDVTQAVKEVSQMPYVKKQTAKFEPTQLRKELKEYGAWDEDELNNHQENIQRWIWLSACDISERMHEEIV